MSEDLDLDTRLEIILMPYVRDKKERESVIQFVKAAVSVSMPDPIDIASKYEMGPEKGVYISLGNDTADGEQLMYLARFSEDQGWNHYNFHVSQLLRPKHIVVQ